MLETVEKEGKTSIISWLPGDPQDTFKVHDKDKFMQQVLPRFFNQTKFKSFLRQLNLWGFERILESGPRRGGYRHSLFIKNQPFLCTKMKRTKIKGAKQGDTGDSQQQQTEGEQHHREAISHRSDDAGGQRLTRNKTNFLNDEETSFDTIEYEKIPDHVPVAADLSRMYDEMSVLLLPPAEAEEHSPILPQPTTNLKRPAIM
ncbi:unnamed protein product [Cylindrotheca closterium]|uniref:HSF-type DNA-binding domain-containing protein n=1 Tax=Cylindrotheca closterium TaxID=2856 RepID=A0AAD2CRS5_9STRA|nr:unnamed protein product [Cylindrotheca closterium]CAJ1957733.1 unnamed protein product [Cylindrotheca closterium]